MGVADSPRLGGAYQLDRNSEVLLPPGGPAYILAIVVVNGERPWAQESGRP